MVRPPLRLGTRGSALALAQAGVVADALGGAELVPVKSEDAPRGDKARFVRSVERALLGGEVEIGVHSAKDLPGELPPELRIAGVPERESPLDAFVGDAASLAELPEGARIGTSSLRRRAQLLATRPDLEVIELHGNVDTRLRRLRAGDFDGVVLAAAGLRRLARDGEIAFRFQAQEMTPAAGQGALALEARVDDRDSISAAERISDPGAEAEVRAERAAVSELDASCRTPLGVNASHDGDRLLIRGFCGLPDGSEWIRDQLEGDAGAPEQVGRSLAERMRGAGADEILRRAEGVAA